MKQEIGRRQQHPAVVIVVTLIVVFIGFNAIGPFIGFFICLPFYPGTMMEMVDALKSPVGKPEMKIPYFIIQGCGTLFGLIIVPILLLKIFRKSTVDYFRQPLFPQAVVLVVCIVVVFMAVNSVFIEWNQNISLPESLSGVEKWAKDLEKQLTELTEYLTRFDSFAQMLLAIVVVAVLPAIGEELVFRGIIQNEFFRGTKNIHVSIWISAAIFSAIHMQFFGFVPRMLLGALFGYLYFWSGSLLMPILAHFINNGFTVIAMYLYQQGSLDLDMDSPEAAPWSVVLSCAIVTTVLLYYFKKFYDGKRITQTSVGR